jgi:SanA protein
MAGRRALLWTTGGFLAAAAVIVGLPNAIVLLGAGSAGHDPARAPHAEVALVLGASAYTDGTPTPALADRLAVGAALYRDRRVDRVLVSGEPGRGFVDQVEVMRRGLVRLGVPDRVIFTDRGGFDTWDSMVRARKVYEVRSAIVVTQGWHMPRALWLGKRAGLEVHGIAADRSGYGLEGRKSKLREVIARVKAVEDVVTGAKPRFLGPKVPVTGSAEASRG